MTEKPVGTVTEPCGERDPGTLRLLVDVFRHLELDDQLHELAEAVASRTGAVCVFGYALDPDRRSFVSASWTRRLGAGRRPAISRIQAGEVSSWGSRAVIRFDDPGMFVDPEAGWKAPLPASVVAWVLQGEDGGTRAVLVLVDPQIVDEEWMVRLGDLAKPALDNAFQFRTVRELVIKDDTANCFNRRYFEEFLPEELARASRFHAPLSLIFFDMDNLKEVNSRFGHAMGSRALREVAERVRLKVRKFDKLFRFGGDEFCVLLPETEWHGALEVAERVRESIAGHPFLVRQQGSPDGVRMTASLGIASFPLHARSKEELVQSADRAMQRIKNGTKNSIGIAESSKNDR